MPPNKAGFDMQVPPELIAIGVDFGMTYTGVAFSTLDWPEPRVIKNWPSPRRIHVENKVPTAVTYRAGRKRIDWGFESPAPAEIRPGMAVWDRFKLFLDPTILKKLSETCNVEDLDLIPTYDDIKMWFEDFLTKLYEYIVAYMTKYFHLKDWEAARVVYSFSVPTTWNNRIDVVKTFEDIIRKAGFGKSEQHSVKIELTEAEAAAVYTARKWKDHRAVGASKELDGVQQGNVLMVCDAGGGTTDVSVLKVGSIKPFRDRNGNEERIAELEQLDCVEGRAIGSVQIDEIFQREVERRLSFILHAEDNDSEYIAEDMVNLTLAGQTRGRSNNRLEWRNFAGKDMIKREAEEMTKSRRKTSFQHFKTTFGTPDFIDYIRVRLPDLFKNLSCPEVGVEGGRMTFTYDDIKEMFDEQIDGIFELISEQLERLQEIHPLQQVSHFVISGGLGSSEYVQECIMRRFGSAPGGQGKVILVAKDPQLSVCKGLVIDHVHRLKFANFILSTICSRASYGILFNKLYDESKHSGPPYKGPLDNQDYALNQIHWLVRAGEPLRRDGPKSHTFYRIVDPETQDPIVCKDVIASSAQSKFLPSNIDEEDAERAYQIESVLDLKDLDQADYVEKKRKFLGIRVKRYWKIEHTISVHAGLSDLRFEMRVGNNVIGERSSIPIIWMHVRGSRQDSVVDGENGEGGEDSDATLFEILDELKGPKLLRSAGTAPF
ncbi:uncharacterized protein K441DRAFT_626083 [Cenococcum geophilum 1.58]|uniref:uncharacterized protein n=1 Tax=Cenococcum geophilum 1.58 TaxID=794803 RepID=UPI00358E2B8A|nr:hypothetical protein K441DRAFT_626083 [Cenococcum geophilum 1.58]